MIQDIESYNPVYERKTLEPSDSVLVFGNRTVYYNNGFPKASDIKDRNLIYAFSIGDKNYFLSLEGELVPTSSIDILRHMENREDAFAIATGYHLYLWYKDRRFCPSCKKPLTHSLKERALVCSCGYTEYPRISPAVITGIIHDGKILLTRYKEGYKNYALVAGYCEIGEAFEDTVRREVKEEVGLEVCDITYYKSQPWGMSGSILAGFFCHVKGNPIPKADGVELGFAEFFSKDEIDLPEDNTTLTRDMILKFKKGDVD